MCYWVGEWVGGWVGWWGSGAGLGRQEPKEANLTEQAMEVGGSHPMERRDV